MHRRPIEPLLLHLPAKDGARTRLPDAFSVVRNELLATWRTVHGPGPPGAQRLLDDYRAGRSRGARQSQLGQILARARLVADQVDRVVVIADRDVCLAAKAVLESCAHPHHNELSRAERGGYPRIDFVSGPADNDALAALLDLLAAPRASSGLDSRWALVIVEDGSAETAIKTQVLVRALEDDLGGDRDRLAQFVESLPGPDHQRASEPFIPGVLMPAALAGLDAVGLLCGAAAMLEHFIHDPPQECLALQLAGLCAPAGPSPQACQMLVWSPALESLGRWHERLRQQAFVGQRVGSQENEAKSATGLHGHRPREKIGRRQLVLNVVAKRLRRDRVPSGSYELTETMQEVRAAAMAAQQAAGQLAAELWLPRIDERSIGQLMQLLLLATAVEARLALNHDPTSMHA